MQAPSCAEAPADGAVAVGVDEQAAQRPRAADVEAQALALGLGEGRQQATGRQRATEGDDLDAAQLVAGAGLVDQVGRDRRDDPQRKSAVMARRSWSTGRA